MDFGAFVDIGGVDGLLHVSDMAYTRNVKPSDVVAVGDTIDVKILKIGKETKKISLGLKQLLPDPWSLVPEKYPVGSKREGQSRARGRFRRVRGTGIRHRGADSRFRDVVDARRTFGRRTW